MIAADLQAEVNSGFKWDPRDGAIPGGYVRKIKVMCASDNGTVIPTSLRSGVLVPWGESELFVFESVIPHIQSLVADPRQTDENTVETDPTNIDAAKRIHQADREEWCAMRGIDLKDFRLHSHEYEGDPSWSATYVRRFAKKGRAPTAAELDGLSPHQQAEVKRRLGDLYKGVLPLRRVEIISERLAPPMSVEAQNARLQADAMTDVIARAIAAAHVAANAPPKPVVMSRPVQPTQEEPDDGEEPDPEPAATSGRSKLIDKLKR